MILYISGKTSLAPSNMRLLCNFASGITDDIAPFLIGAATEAGTGLSFSDGVFSFTQVISVEKNISWTDSVLKIEGGPMTLEFIFKVSSITPIPPTSSMQIGKFIPDTGSGSVFFRFAINGLIAGSNKFVVTAPGAITTTDTINAVDISSYHFAIVFGSSGTYDYYFHGRKVTPTGNTNPVSNVNEATILLGGTGQSTQQTLHEYFDVRMTAAELYSADFTPLTSLPYI